VRGLGTFTLDKFVAVLVGKTFLIIFEIDLTLRGRGIKVKL